MTKVATLACVAALAASLPCLGATTAEMDMRVPKSCYLSAAVDVDAICAEAPTAIRLVKDGLAACSGTNGSIKADVAQSALASIDKAASWVDEAKRACGVSPEDFHWIMLAGRNHHFWVQRDCMVTQFVWGAAISAERLDWKRIETYTTDKGLKWVSEPGIIGDTLFCGSSHTVSWFGTSGYLAGMFYFLVGNDEMVYPGNGYSLYGVYGTEGPFALDERPSRRGKLEKGEIVRVVLSDFHAMPLFFQMIADIPQFRPDLENIDEGRISLFILDGKVGARLVVEFADETKAAIAKAKYEADITMPWKSWSDTIGRELARARRLGPKGMIEVYETLLEWQKEITVRLEGRTLTVDTGRIDERKFFTVLAVPLSNLLGDK